MIVRFCRFILFAFAMSFASNSAIARPPVPKDSPEIISSAAKIRAHMEMLADDLMEGREAGTRGDRLAQLYISTRFAAIGLQPAGDAGTYLQRFSLRATRLVPGSVKFTLGGPNSAGMFPNGNDITIFGDPMETEQYVDAKLVFAGYGIVAPQIGIDDYKGLDVQGKVAVVMGGPPAFLPPAEAAHYGSTDQQRIAAEQNGAIGVVHLWTPALETRFPWSGMKNQTGRTDANWIGPDGKVNVTAPRIRLRAFTNGKATSTLLAGGPKTMDALLEQAETDSPEGFPLPGNVTLISQSVHDDQLTTANVAGLLRGSDPDLADEFVVVTAHYDHVGIGTAIDGDNIYNGALDNASGTAGLIEVARQLANAKARPKRSILFLAVGAEEKGLVGSDYFAQHPIIVRGKTVANINLDGLTPFYDFSDIIAFGAEQSQMGEHLKTAAKQLGLTVGPDPFPEEGIFARSDQYSFVKRGIPSVFLYPGFTDMNGDSIGRHYWDTAPIHLPNDDLLQPIDYDVIAKFADLFRRLVLVTANTEDRPLWYDDSIFGTQFAPNEAKATRPRN